MDRKTLISEYKKMQRELRKQKLEQQKAQRKLKNQKIKSDRLEKKYKAMRCNLEKNEPRVPIIKDVPRKRGLCPFCAARAPYMPSGYACWIRTPAFQDWITLTEENREDARSRLSKTTDCPETIEDCSDTQKRCISYLKVFRYWYDKGQSGVRIPHPACVVGKIRKTFPEGFNGVEFDFSNHDGSQSEDE